MKTITSKIRQIIENPKIRIKKYRIANLIHFGNRILTEDLLVGENPLFLYIKPELGAYNIFGKIFDFHCYGDGGFYFNNRITIDDKDITIEEFIILCNKAGIHLELNPENELSNILK